MKVLSIIIMICGIVGGIGLIADGALLDGILGGAIFLLAGFWFYKKSKPKNKNSTVKISYKGKTNTAPNANPKYKENNSLSFDFVCIDFETANSSRNSACSVGLVAVNGLQIVSENSYLIKPPTKNFGYYNIKTHGITYDKVCNCNTFDELYDEILKYVDNASYVLAHGASFDMGVLEQSLDYYNLKYPNLTFIDTINFTSPVRDCKDSLYDCAEYFNVNILNQHDALCDARTCAEIAIESMKLASASSIFEYLERYRYEIRNNTFSELRIIESKKGTHDNSSDNPVGYKDDKIIDVPFSSIGLTNWKGKKVVFTGIFTEIERSDLEDELRTRGARVLKNLTQKTNYLIVGSEVEPMWKHGNYGKKIENAINWNSSGVSTILIVREKDVLSVLK